jgi:SLOG family YspA-like protein
MRLLVCGGRHFRDVPLLWRELDKLRAALPEPGIELLIEGASDDVTGPYQGADYWAREWAKARSIPSVSVHAKWGSVEGRAAGPLRNQHMLLKKPDVVLAFVGGRGTADMVAKAREAKIAVVQITK